MSEFHQLDNHLNRQAAAAFLVSGSLITLGIAFGFRRLRHSYSLLQQRTRALLGANRELVQGAKTSAVGAVTSHLIHELRNPLSGVHNLMVQQARENQGEPVSEVVPGGCSGMFTSSTGTSARREGSFVTPGRMKSVIGSEG